MKKEGSIVKQTLNSLQKRLLALELTCAIVEVLHINPNDLD
ncbi:hypothetical protein [Peribacillus kribbensis]|nr:hypothetical protein [Peribacillus kribbensis]